MVTSSARLRSLAGAQRPGPTEAAPRARAAGRADAPAAALGAPVPTPSAPRVRWIAPPDRREPAHAAEVVEVPAARGGPALSMPGRLAMLAYLLAIVGAELLTVWRPVAGMLVHTALLMLLLGHAALTEARPRRDLVLALALAPLIRIVSLAMPLGNIPQVSWYLVISLPLFTAAAVIARLANLGRRDLGLVVDVAPAQWLIMSAGIPLGAIEYVILRPQPLVAGLGGRSFWLSALILVVSTGFLEELIFRGLLQHVALRAFGGGGIVYVSALFAALHIGHRSALDVGFVLLVALLFADARRRTGSLLGVTIAHGLTNTLLFLICPFLLGS